jgi:hypothetical protein
MNSLKQLLLVIVATGLVGSSFAIEEAPGPGTDTPAPAAKRRSEASAASRTPLAGGQLDGVALPAETLETLETLYLLANTVPVKAIVSTPVGSAPPTAKTSAAPAETRSAAAADTEPTEWMQLLCGLMVAGFIVRRRTSAMAD